MADKCAGDKISLLELNHISDLDQGGLWKVNEGVIVNFGVAESYLLSSTKKPCTK